MHSRCPIALLRAATAGLCIALAAGCSRERSALRAFQDEAQPLARLEFAGDDGEALPDRKVYIARQYHRTSYPTPHRSEKKRVAVDRHNRIRLGDVIGLDRLSPEAVGVVMVIYDAIHGPVYRTVRFNPGATQQALDGVRLNVLPRPLQSVRGRVTENVSVWAREILPLPREATTLPVRLPPDAALDFALMPEALASNMPAHANPYEPPDIGERPSIRATVTIETLSETSEVFSETLESPHVSQELDFAENDTALKHLRRVDVSDWAGQAARFVFRVEPAGDSDVFDSASWIWANPVLLSTTQPQERDRTNVIMISLDTLRADHLGAYGYDRDTSPNLDAFAEDAVLFERAMATASWTTPSHTTVFTGLPPSLHRTDNFAHRRLRPELVTLAELARERGYLTAAFTEGIAMSGGRGFHQGFDLYSDGWGVPLKSGSAGKTFAQAQAWLEQYSGRPFFLYVHTYEIHAPYQAPSPFKERFAPNAPASIAPRQRHSASGARDVQAIIDAYDAEIAYTDHVLGEFLDDVRESKLLDNTMIVIFSDHGEEFFEHGGFEHGKTLYQEQLHVPLIVRMPGAAPPRSRVDTLVCLSDIFATVVTGAGWDAPAPETSHALQPLFGVGEGPYPRTLTSAVQRFAGRYVYMYALQTAQEKYIVTTRYRNENSPIDLSGVAPFAQVELPMVAYLLEHPEELAPPPVSEELFDLRADPGETVNLLTDAIDPVRDARARLHAWVRSLAGHPLLGEAEGEAPKPLTEAEKAELRALGYVQ